MHLTVITACLPSAGHWLREAAGSIPARLDTGAGTWTVEWVLSVDGPGAIPDVTAAAPTTTIRSGTRQGVSAARNRALHTAAGRWIVNLDADDTLIAAGLGQVAHTIDTHEGVGWAAGVLMSDGTTPYPPCSDASSRTWTPGQLVNQWAVPMAFHPGAAWMRRDLLYAAGGWPALAHVEDKLPILTVSELAAGVTVTDATHSYRRHRLQTSSTREHAASRQYALEFTCEVLTARRRLADPGAAYVEPVRAQSTSDTTHPTD